MPNERSRVLLYRTDVPYKKIEPEEVDYGELAMNMSDETPFLMFRTSEDNIAEIAAIGTRVTGYTVVSGVTDLPSDYRMVKVELYTAGTFSFIERPIAGQRITFLLHNNATREVQVTMPNTSEFIKIGDKNAIKVQASNYVLLETYNMEDVTAYVITGGK